MTNLKIIISEFLAERRSKWLKRQAKLGVSQKKPHQIEQEANEKFLLVNWLPDAARRAGQLSMASHPGKFSHPSAKISSIIAVAAKLPDGFLRTGNSNASVDVYGNAAAIDVYEFLSLGLDDGNSLFNHIERCSDTARQELTIATTSFDEIRRGLLAIKQPDESVETSEQLKQVYFPFKGNYHLLSIVTPSGLIFELKARIDTMRFAQQSRDARALRKKEDYSEQGFDDLYDLTIIGYGGTKPQNISILNNKNGGKSYLLPCLPPLLQKRDVRLPRYNFFDNTLWIGSFKERFTALHRILLTDYNNIDIRAGRDNIIHSILDMVVEEQWAVRAQTANWSQLATYSKLPQHQKVWLDSSRSDERNENDGWLSDVITDFSHWIIKAYKQALGKRAILLADSELLFIQNVLEQNKDFLR